MRFALGVLVLLGCGQGRASGGGEHGGPFHAPPEPLVSLDLFGTPRSGTDGWPWSEARGDSCPPRATFPVSTAFESPGVVCQRGELVGLFTPVEFSVAPRDGVRTVLREVQAPPGQLRQVIVGRDTIAIHELTCATCGHPGGWAFIGVPTRLRTSLLQKLQGHLGLPSSPPLKTPAAWRRVLSDHAETP
ncbi:MAG: hypothetical protein AAGF12_02755 [Myxococcota bacterium]